MADAWAMLGRLRRHDRDLARHRLAQAIEAERCAHLARAEAEAALAAEAGTADAWAFAAWLPQARADIAREAGRCAATAAGMAAAAQALRVCETAVATLDDLGARRVAAATRREQALEQARLDEVAGRVQPRPGALPLDPAKGLPLRTLL